MSDPQRSKAPLQLELDSDPRYLAGAREMVAAVARRFGFAETACARIALAVDEALANVICHGYDRDPGGRIWLSVEPPGAVPFLRIVIEDEGGQVEPDRIRSRDLGDIRPGGLGVHIINEVMDEVRYEKRDPAGMRLIMLKRHDTHPEGGHGAPRSSEEDPER